MTAKTTYAVIAGGVFALHALSGCVPAVVAGAGAGATVAVQERSAGQAVDDYAIWTKIRHLYLQSGRDGLGAGVNVEVVEGRVHLTGKVPTPQARLDAAKLAWDANGVRTVTNDIEVDDTSSLGDYAKDKWIFTQMKARLLAEKGVRSVNYSVEVVNAVVYIMGVAQNGEELDRVVRVARSIPGVKNVVIHARIK